MTKINYRFRIPMDELCPKCREIIEARKKEQMRVSKRLYMIQKRSNNKNKKA